MMVMQIDAELAANVREFCGPDIPELAGEPHGAEIADIGRCSGVFAAVFVKNAAVEGCVVCDNELGPV
jgi:hypothetical protein